MISLFGRYGPSVLKVSAGTEVVKYCSPCGSAGSSG